MSQPWRIHFFRRHPDDDPEASVPVVEFLGRVPPKVVAEMQVVLEAVARVARATDPLWRSGPTSTGAPGCPARP